MPRIYSFYGDVPELNRFDELKLSVLWRERWNKAGWEPFILSEWHGRKHPLFTEFDAAVSKLPSVNPKQYEVACYHRWLALAQIGGGWMSDLDVMPRGDTDVISKTLWDAEGDKSKLMILQTPCCPSLVYCSKENAERLCREFMKGIGSRPQDGRPHFSDQYALDDLVAAGADWIDRRDVVKDYTDTGWESASVVHFANRIMAPKQLTPRWRHIPAILDAK